MPTLGTITLVDSDAASHVFSPSGRAGPEFTDFACPGGLTPISEEYVSLKFLRASNQVPTDRTKVNLAIPVYYTDADGNEAVDDIWRFKCEVISPRLLSLAQRELNWSVAKALVAHATLASYVEDRDPYYGG